MFYLKSGKILIKVALVTDADVNASEKPDASVTAGCSWKTNTSQAWPPHLSHLPNSSCRWVMDTKSHLEAWLQGALGRVHISFKTVAAQRSEWWVPHYEWQLNSGLWNQFIEFNNWVTFNNWFLSVGHKWCFKKIKQNRI